MTAGLLSLRPAKAAVYKTTDSGQTWRTSDLGLEKGERVTALALSADGQAAVAAGNQGSVRRTTVSRQMWPATGLPVKGDEWLSGLAISADGGTTVAIAAEGYVFISTDGGKTWRSINFPRQGTEVVTSAVSADGQNVVVMERNGSVHMNTDEEQTWRTKSLPLRDVGRGSIRFERFALPWYWSTVSVNGQAAMVVAKDGSVHVTANGGQRWRSTRLALREGEGVTEFAVSASGQNAVVVGTESSLFVTGDGGRDWKSTRFTGEGNEWVMGVIWVGEDAGPLQTILSNFPGEGFVARTDSGNFYLLAVYPELTNWKELSPETIRNAMEVHNVLRNSSLFQRISTFLDQTRDPISVEKKNNAAVTNSVGRLLSLDDLTVQRIVASTILFFLVQLLVRLYQYSLRLAAFWESRSDAILLHHSFGERKAERFEDLVGALAPDTYDFKGIPKSPLEWLRPRQKR